MFRSHAPHGMLASTNGRIITMQVRSQPLYERGTLIVTDNASPPVGPADKLAGSQRGPK